MSYRKRNPRRRAAVAALVAIMLPVLVGFTVLTVDVGTMYNARSDMQRAADAAALAAASEFAYAADGEDPTVAATAAAADFVSRNPVLGQTMYLNTDKDLVFGRAYYDAVGNTYSFVPGDTPTNAVRVSIRHSEDSPNGPLPLRFAGVFGKSVTDVSADSVAMFVPTCYEQGDCYDEDTEESTVMCQYSNGSDGGGDDSGEGDAGSGDSESSDPNDDDSPHTIIVDANAVPLFLSEGDTLGACDYCPVGDSDDSDDSQGEFGPPDSSDSDDSDPGDSDGSVNGDSDDSDDSQGEFGPPDSDDSDASDSGDSDGSDGGDSDDSDDSQGEFGPADSDDSDDSDAGGPGVPKVTICHIPPGNPDNPQTITVGSPAVPAHLAHGDALGACPKNKSGNAKKCAASSIRLFLIE